MRIILSILSIIILSLFACNEGTIEPATKEFMNTIWKLESMRIDNETITPQTDQTYIAIFEEDSTLSGTSDCNDFSANFLLLSEDSLIIEQFFITEKGCGGDQSFSDRYVQVLRDARTYKIDMNKLTVFDINNSQLMFIGK